MGTRADFYVGRGETAEWLGSIAWDGNPGGVDVDDQEGGRAVIRATTEGDYQAAVAAFLAQRDDATVPERGWPWPWDDSRTTDYAYAWDDGALWACSFGGTWFRPDPDVADFGEPEESYSVKTAVFPDMTERNAVTYGPRSGVIAVAEQEGGQS
jgi:hypothetical protein